MGSATEIYLRGSAGDPAVRALALLRDRNDELLAETWAKAALLSELRLAAADRQTARDGMVVFCTDRVLCHLVSVDWALYAPASGAADTRLLVRALRAQHQIITGHIHDLRAASTADQVNAAAHAVATALAACQEVERRVLLPALAELPGVDLVSLVEDLETLLDGGSLEPPDELDVRGIPHGQRHPRIFGSFARLAKGESFVLVNNHDPKPLRREFEATYPGQFAWEYVESGPIEWRIRIGRFPVAAHDGQVDA